jgi:hypothetical protein
LVTWRVCVWSGSRAQGNVAMARRHNDDDDDDDG